MESKPGGSMTTIGLAGRSLAIWEMIRRSGVERRRLRNRSKPLIPKKGMCMRFGGDFVISFFMASGDFLQR